MAAWPHNPAMIYDRAYDVVAANPMADALFAGGHTPATCCAVVFGDPPARPSTVDWAEVAADAVAGFRFGHGRHPSDPRVRERAGRDAGRRPEFADCGGEDRVRGKVPQHKHFEHADVGRVALTMQAFDVRASPGRELVVYHAEAGSSERGIR